MPTVKTVSGATAVQIAYFHHQESWDIEHIRPARYVADDAITCAAARPDPD